MLAISLTNEDTEAERENDWLEMGHLELKSLTGNATLLSTRQATVGDWPTLSLSSPNLVPKILPGICLCVSSNSSSPYQRGFPGRLRLQILGTKVLDLQLIPLPYETLDKICSLDDGSRHLSFPSQCPGLWPVPAQWCRSLNKFPS